MTGVASVSAWSTLDVVLGAGLVVTGCAAAGVALYLLTLSVSALFYRPLAGSDSPSTRLIVLVPAHNEAALIGRCVRSLRRQTYPRELYQIVVVADNCNDDTAPLAAGAGADAVLTRDEEDQRGKGQALRWAMDRLLSERPEASAIVVVDADSVADPNFLTVLVAPLEAGARAVQGESLLYGDGSPRTELRVAAFLLVNRTRPSGRAALGLSATHLAGNGMLLSRALLTAHPWSAFTSAEDLEYSLALKMRGIRIAFAGGAVVQSPAAPTARAAVQQQLRWEGGKAHLARTEIPRLARAAVRRRRPELLAAALDLTVPPLGFLASGTLAGALAATALAMDGVVPVWTAVPWVVACAAIPPFVLIGLRAARAPAAAYRALAGTPRFLVRKVIGAPRVATFRGDTWIRTERAADPHAGRMKT